MFINGGTTKDTYTSRWNEFLKIPSGYRPYIRVTGIAYGLYGNPTATVAIEGGGMNFVKNALSSDGALSIYFSATWITSDDFPD